MAEVTRRTVVTYRWVCVDKERCEQIDEQIEQIVYHTSKLSSYREKNEITGLDCLVLAGKFKWILIELRNERKTLWRRIRREVEEEIENTDSVAPKPLVNIGHIGRLDGVQS